MTDIKNAPDIDTTVLEDLDFEQQCEATGIHAKHGSGKVITLITWKQPCCSEIGEVYACVGCTHYATTSKETGKCGYCGDKWMPYKSCVAEVVYI